MELATRAAEAGARVEQVEGVLVAGTRVAEMLEVVAATEAAT